jgi:hypothetical protein
VLTDIGAVEVDVPRDRNGEFTPQIVSKGRPPAVGVPSATAMFTQTVPWWVPSVIKCCLRLPSADSSSECRLPRPSSS